MEQPTNLHTGQVWKDKTLNHLYIIHRSPTGKNYRALNLTTFVAAEWFSVPTWVEFVCILNGKELL